MKCATCGSELTTADPPGSWQCFGCREAVRISAYSPHPCSPQPHRCPVCDGSGLVSRPPWVAGDQMTWTASGAGPYQCHACGGSGVLWK